MAERLVVLPEGPGDVELVGSIPHVLVAVGAGVRHEDVVVLVDRLSADLLVLAWRSGTRTS